MRLCLVSDSHRHRDELLAAVECVPRVDAVLHAGDETADAVWLAERVQCPVYGVAGNWDRESADFPVERVITQYGPAIYLTHGHQWRVKEGLAPLAKRAKQLGARIAVFGHTHTAMAAVSEDIVFINPGSLAQPRGRRQLTFAVLEVRAGADTDGFHIRVSHMTTRGVVSDPPLESTISMRDGG